MYIDQLTSPNKTSEAAKAEQVAAEWGLQTFNLWNRRYLGGKSKLLKFIDSEVNLSLRRKPTSVFDVFSGTGVVANLFATQRIPVVANDILQHNYFGLLTFLGVQKLSLNSLAEKIVYLSSLVPNKNYFSMHFGNSYFSEENAMKIGTIREEIERISGSLREKAALVTSLIYAADKVANTVGHYDAFHRGQDIQTSLELKLPNISQINTSINEVYCQDSMILAPKVKAEVSYLDPPYNSRQYSDAYHLLENLAAWEKPEVHGVAKKMNRSHLKSDFCGKAAAKSFAELILKLDSKLIIVSYNNTSDSLNSRSNAAISDEEITQSLKSRGTVSVKEVVFTGFTAGKTKKREHAERLFICKVKD
jgi:adenine-specific DNA-methyltransferase